MNSYEFLFRSDLRTLEEQREKALSQRSMPCPYCGKQMTFEEEDTLGCCSSCWDYEVKE